MNIMTDDNPMVESPEESQPMKELSEMMIDKAEEKIVAPTQAEISYDAEIEKFNTQQTDLIREVEDKLPPACPSCQTYVRADRDTISIERNAECFSCYTKTETHKTEVAKDTLMAEETNRIASLDLSDYEEWLFGDELGQISLARLMTKVKREGYDYKPWQISIGASAWSLENYHNTSIGETRHFVERMPIKDLLDFIPANTQDIIQVINSVKRAEDTMTPTDKRGMGAKPLFILAGITGVAALIPVLLGRR
tara:strand:+ start:2617 stop:3372 length:756 start_codon:yes stop_codon:yes gene_type:complete